MDPTLPTTPVTPQSQTIWEPIPTDTCPCLGHAPNCVQIDSPQRIPQELRRPFEVGRAKMLLVVGSQDRLPAMLATIGETSLVVDTDASTMWRKPDQRVLAVFPVPGRSYILQTVIEAIAVQQLTLRYQDPRYYVRRHVPLDSPVSLRLVRPETVEAIKRRQVRVMRGLRQPAEGAGSSLVIADRLYSGPAADPSVALPGLSDTEALSCDLKDLSLGGMALTSPVAPPAEIIDHCLERVQFALPGLSGASPEPDDPPLVLDLLGIIRQVEISSMPWIMRIRFLARLPETCAAYFERLERDAAARRPFA